MTKFTDIEWLFLIPFIWIILPLGILAMLLFYTGFVKIQQHRWLHLLSSLLVTVSLFILVASPQISSNEKALPILLHTQNANLKEVDKLNKSQEFLKVFSSTTFQIYLDSLEQKQTDLLSAGISGVHIIGDGLEEKVLDKLSTTAIESRLNPTPSEWSLPLVPLNSIEGERTYATLTWNGDNYDSLRVLKNGKVHSNFNWLADEKKLMIALDSDRSGRYLYDIQAFKKQDHDGEEMELSSSQNFGHEVFSRSEQEVLMLSGELGYELPRYSDYISKKGHFTKVRSQLSDKIFHYQNAEKGSKLSDLLPQNRGVLLINTSAIMKLSSEENALIAKKMRQGKLNIWLMQVQPKDISRFPSFWRQMCSKFKTVASNLAREKISAKQFQSKEVETAGFSFSKSSNSTILFSGLSGRGISASTYYKGGKVVWSALNNLHLLPLTGEKVLMQYLMDQHLDALSMESSSNIRFHLPSHPIIEKGRKVPIEILQTEPPMNWKVRKITSGNNSEQAIHFRNTAHMNFYWHSEYWPKETGWHQAWTEDENGNTAQNERFSFYVSDSTSWSKLRRTELIEANQQFAKSNSSIEIPATYEKKKALPRTIPFIILLISLSVIWIIEKRNS